MHGDFGQRGGIGAHVGNETVFVKALCRVHRATRGEAQFTVRLLLQRAGCERRFGLLGKGLHVQRRDAELCCPQTFRQLACSRFVEQQQRGIFQLSGGRIEVLGPGDPPPVDADEYGSEGLTVLFGKGSDQVPVGRRHVLHPLPLSLHDQPHGHALHAARGQTGPDFLPQQLGNVVTVEPIQNAAGLLRTDQPFVDFARMLEALLDGGPSDFVKHQAVHRHLGFQQLAQMPTDGFSLPVFVGRQIEVLGLLERLRSLVTCCFLPDGTM